MVFAELRRGGGVVGKTDGGGGLRRPAAADQRQWPDSRWARDRGRAQELDDGWGRDSGI